MKELSPEQFATLCFVVLMENSGGIKDKSPGYFLEKSVMPSAGYHAFGYLDINNMTKVINWHTTWGVPVPGVIAEHFKQERDAYNNLSPELQKALGDPEGVI